MREFYSIELASWLQEQNVSFVLRQKQTTTFREKRQSFQPLSSIPIKPGIRQFTTNINLTQKVGKARFNLAVYWKRKYRGKQEDEARASFSAVARRKARAAKLAGGDLRQSLHALHAVFINQFTRF